MDAWSFGRTPISANDITQPNRYLVEFIFSFRAQELINSSKRSTTYNDVRQFKSGEACAVRELLAPIGFLQHINDRPQKTTTCIKEWAFPAQKKQSQSRAIATRDATRGQQWGTKQSLSI